MKRLVALLLYGVGMPHAFAQTGTRDSLKLLLQSEKQDTAQVLLLAKLSRSYYDENTEMGLATGQQGLSLARKINFEKGEGMCLNALALNYCYSSNYLRGLRAGFDALRIFEHLDDSLDIMMSYEVLSNNYEDMGDYRSSLVYCYKIVGMRERHHDYNGLMVIQGNMGNSFELLGQMDSALYFEQNSYQIAVGTKQYSRSGLIMARLGNIHAEMGNLPMAYDFYRMGIGLGSDNDYNTQIQLYYGLSKFFQKRDLMDSSIYYAKKSLWIARQQGYPEDVINASALISSLYNRSRRVDSAFVYLELAQVTKDTLMTQDKLKRIQVLTFEENSRDQEVIDVARKAQLDRQRDIQYVALGIGLIIALLLVLLLSYSIVVNEKWIKYLGIIALLTVFEFINLIVHPYLEAATNGSPFLMLVAQVIIAAVLVPAHHRLERVATKMMIEKNIKIRLAAAKRTVSKLEGDKGVENP